VNQAVGDASYGHRGLSALSKQLGEGFSPEALQHCRGLARHWSREDAAVLSHTLIALLSDSCRIKAVKHSLLVRR